MAHLEVLPPHLRSHPPYLLSPRLRPLSTKAAFLPRGKLPVGKIKFLYALKKSELTFLPLGNDVMLVTKIVI